MKNTAYSVMTILRKIGTLKLFIALLLASATLLFYLHNRVQAVHEQQAAVYNEPKSLHSTINSRSNIPHVTQTNDHAAHHHTPHVTQIGTDIYLPKLTEAQLATMDQYNANDAKTTKTKQNHDYLTLLSNDKEYTAMQQHEAELKAQRDLLTSSSSVLLSSPNLLNRKPLSETEDNPNPETDVVTATDPLDISVTQHWEQITAELWSALSRGSVPTLPTAMSANSNDDKEDDGNENTDDAEKKKVKDFIAAASSKAELNLYQELFESDDRCIQIFDLLEKEINIKLNTSLLEIGTGVGISTINQGASSGSASSSGDPLLDTIENNGDDTFLGDYDPFVSHSTKTNSDRKSSHHKKSRVQGCVGILAAQKLSKCSVVHMGGM